MIIVSIKGNKDIESFVFDDRGALAAPAHNSHIGIMLHPSSIIDRQQLLYNCLKLDGVVERGSIADATSIAFGKVEPGEPLTVVKNVLGLLQQGAMLSEAEVRKIYLDLGFPTKFSEIPARKSTSAPMLP